jgi:hypothetical protein
MLDVNDDLVGWSHAKISGTHRGGLFKFSCRFVYLGPLAFGGGGAAWGHRFGGFGNGADDDHRRLSGPEVDLFGCSLALDDWGLFFFIERLGAAKATHHYAGTCGLGGGFGLLVS